MTAGVRYAKVSWAEGTHMKKVRDSHTVVPEGFPSLESLSKVRQQNPLR